MVLTILAWIGSHVVEAGTWATPFSLITRLPFLNPSLASLIQLQIHFVWDCHRHLFLTALNALTLRPRPRGRPTPTTYHLYHFTAPTKRDRSHAATNQRRLGLETPEDSLDDTTPAPNTHQLSLVPASYDDLLSQLHPGPRPSFHHGVGSWSSTWRRDRISPASRLLFGSEQS